MSSQERSEHARHEFNYYSSDLKKALNLVQRPEPLRKVMDVMADIVALPFAARAYLMNDGMYRTATKSDGSPAYVVPAKAPKDPGAGPS